MTGGRLVGLLNSEAVNKEGTARNAWDEEWENMGQIAFLRSCNERLLLNTWAPKVIYVRNGRPQVIQYGPG